MVHVSEQGGSWTPTVHVAVFLGMSNLEKIQSMLKELYILPGLGKPIERAESHG